MNKKIVLKGDLRQLMYYWIEIISPFNKLDPTERKVTAELLYHYFMFKQQINDEGLIWKNVFDYDTRIKIREALISKKGNEMSGVILNQQLLSLRKKGVIKSNQITAGYIPPFRDGEGFNITYKFDYVDKLSS